MMKMCFKNCRNIVPTRMSEAKINGMVNVVATISRGQRSSQSIIQPNIITSQPKDCTQSVAQWS